LLEIRDFFVKSKFFLSLRGAALLCALGTGFSIGFASENPGGERGRGFEGKIYASLTGAQPPRLLFGAPRAEH